MRKTIYVRDEDVYLYKAAVRVHRPVSATLAIALRRYLKFKGILDEDGNLIEEEPKKTFKKKVRK